MLGAFEANTLVIKGNLGKSLRRNFEVLPKYTPHWRAFYRHPYKGVLKAGVVKGRKRKGKSGKGKK